MGTSPSSQRRLDPFVLPVETDLRFLLLMVSVVLLGSFIGYTVIKLLAPELTPAIGVEAGPDVNDPAFEEKTIRLAQSTLVTSVKLLAIPTILILGNFLVGGLLYWMHPLAIRRQKQTFRLKPGVDAEFESELEMLGRKAGLSTQPMIEISKDFTTDGQAYGLRERYFLRLGGGMRLLMRKGRDLFQAIILHEMAHIYNRDVWRTYLAQSVWATTIWTTLLPLLFTLSYLLLWREIGQPLLGLSDFKPAALWEKSLSFLLIIVQSAACLLLVAATRAGLLRSRELYADWRAVTWGAGAGLKKIFEQATKNVSPSHKSTWFRLHPPVKDRSTLLSDPSGLFKLNLDLPFLVGVLVAWIIHQSTLILPTLLVGSQALGILIYINGFRDVFGLLRIFQAAILGIVFLGLAYLLAGSLGRQVQRKVLWESINAKTDVHSYFRLFSPALLVAAGMEIGFWIIPLGTASTVAWPSAQLIVQFLLLATFLNWLGLSYAQFTGLKVLGQHTGKTSPTWKSRFLILPLIAILSIFYLYMTYWRACYVFIDDPANTELCGFAPQGLSAVIVIYIVLFIGTYVSIKLKQSLWPARCPHCGTAVKTALLIGKNHPDCDKPLTEWLFVPGSFLIADKISEDEPQLVNTL
jgi:Zn-dependent protease with chaperone function